MPVTIQPASHKASISDNRYRNACSTAETLLQHVSDEKHKVCKELLQSSFSFDPKTPTVASENGFVSGAIQAYNNHHHLVIKPEDIWFAILNQLSIYINKDAEELRGRFVAHDGKKELECFYLGNRYCLDWGMFAHDIGLLLEKNVVEPELREWIMPAFTTTTKNDEVVASILMMGAMQSYFTYKCTLRCGLPSVTLLGEKADWQKMLSRLEKLTTFGEEPSHWYKLLKPVLSRFVRTFDEPSSTEVVDFWQRIAHFSPGRSGPSYYSGWITAFCFWDKRGEMVWKPPFTQNSMTRTDPRTLVQESTSATSWQKTRYPSLCLDGTQFHRVESDEVPPGWTSVPVKVDDSGYEFDATMIAGSVGIKYTSSGNITAESKVGIDTVQAENGWWMFENKT